MEYKVGDIINKDGIEKVITKIDDEFIIETCPIKDYIESTCFVSYKDKYITIKELVKNLIDEYRYNHKFK